VGIADFVSDQIGMLEDRLERLEMDLEEERQANACIQCKVNARDVIILPCAHFLYCHECHQGSEEVCVKCEMKICGFMRVKLDT
jgi:hypothetical protein